MASLYESLISYWKLDESSGNALDAHGSNDLTETSGTIGTGTGKINGARDFEAGDTEYFNIASNSSLQIGNIAASWSVWVNGETLTGNPIIFRKGGAGTTAGLEYVLYRDSGVAQFRFQVSDGSATTAVADNNAPVAGNWYFIIVDHDPVGDVIGIQVNNGTRLTAAHSTGIQAAAGDFNVGASPVQALYWDGLIDELGFWKRALTTDERTRLYNSNNGLAYSDFDTGPALPYSFLQQAGGLLMVSTLLPTART